MNKHCTCLPCQRARERVELTIFLDIMLRTFGASPALPSLQPAAPSRHDSRIAVIGRARNA